MEWVGVGVELHWVGVGLELKWIGVVLAGHATRWN